LSLNSQTLADLLANLRDAPDDDLGNVLVDTDPHEFIADITNVKTFSDAGLLTNNDGIVIRMKDGSEYQITIVQSLEGGAE
jgi:hypothetical protein